jgi:hypothetical protein
MQQHLPSNNPIVATFHSLQGSMLVESLATKISDKAKATFIEKQISFCSNSYRSLHASSFSNPAKYYQNAPLALLDSTITHIQDMLDFNTSPAGFIFPLSKLSLIWPLPDLSTQ